MRHEGAAWGGACAAVPRLEEQVTPSTPVAATHWSSRKMAAQIVVRPSTMMRHWQACCTVERLMKRPAGRGQSVNRWSWPRCKGCPGSTVHRRLEPIGYIPSAEAEANCYWQHAVRSPRWRADANQATSTIPGVVCHIAISVFVGAAFHLDILSRSTPRVFRNGLRPRQHLPMSSSSITPVASPRAFFQVLKLHQRVYATLEAALAHQDLTPPQYTALSLVRYHEPVSPAELSQETPDN